jgi:hypothetical protein
MFGLSFMVAYDADGSAFYVRRLGVHDYTRHAPDDFFEPVVVFVIPAGYSGSDVV